VAEVKKEITQAFESVHDFIQNEINLAKIENGKLINDLQIKIRVNDSTTNLNDRTKL